MIELKKKMQEIEDHNKLNEFITSQKLNIPSNLSNLLDTNNKNQQSTNININNMNLNQNAANNNANINNKINQQKIPIPKTLSNLPYSMNNPQISALSEIEQKIRETEERKFNPNIDLENMPKEDTYKLFKDMLRRAGITSTWKWEDCERVLQSETIWKIIKTFSEKRNLFNEYIKECKTRERDEQQLKKEKLRSKYRQMLEEDQTITSDVKFCDVIKKFFTEERWRSIDEREREDLFQDYLDDLEKKEIEEKKISRELKMRNFKKILEEKRLPITTKWHDICLNFKDDNYFNSIEKIDSLKTFSEYILDFENKQKSEKDYARKLNEYKNRENFREFLQSLVDKSELNSKMKWKNFANKIQNDVNYLNLLGQEGSTPKDLFDDVMSILKEDYKRNKDTLKKILKANSIKFSSDTNFEEFEKRLKIYEDYNFIREDMRNILWSNLTNKLKEKEKEFLKNEKKAIKKLESFIKKKTCFNKESEFEDVLSKVKSHSRFVLIPQEKIKNVFDKLKELLLTGDLVVENVNDTSSESGQIKKKKNKKKSKKKKRRKNSDTSKADNDSLSDEKSFKKARYVYDYEENRKFVAEKDNGNDNLKFEENKFQMDLGYNKSERKYSNFKRGESEEKEPGETSD